MAGTTTVVQSDYRYLGAHEHGAYAQYVKLARQSPDPASRYRDVRAGGSFS